MSEYSAKDAGNLGALAMICIIILMLVLAHIFIVMRSLECKTKGTYVSFWGTKEIVCEVETTDNTEKCR